MYLDFSRVAGGVTGRLLPTGKRKDELLLANGRRLTVTIIDAGNLTVLVDAEELGLTGCEIRESEMVTAWSVLEDVRQSVGRMLGLYREGKLSSPRHMLYPRLRLYTGPLRIVQPTKCWFRMSRMTFQLVFSPWEGYIRHTL
ncbi:hypothetical protein GCM10025858_27430 [Alicyclobacillus sacchari]|nr:hypothetical protein GCM10025858_27430 [Alicyclobacillus sacchari]